MSYHHEFSCLYCICKNHTLQTRYKRNTNHSLTCLQQCFLWKISMIADPQVLHRRMFSPLEIFIFLLRLFFFFFLNPQDFLLMILDTQPKFDEISLNFITLNSNALFKNTVAFSTLVYISIQWRVMQLQKTNPLKGFMGPRDLSFSKSNTFILKQKLFLT